jgi:hypothetical protein
VITAVPSSQESANGTVRLAVGYLPAGHPARGDSRALAEALARTTYRPAREDLR